MDSLYGYRQGFSALGLLRCRHLFAPLSGAENLLPAGRRFSIRSLGAVVYCPFSLRIVNILRSMGKNLFQKRSVCAILPFSFTLDIYELETENNNPNERRSHQ